MIKYKRNMNLLDRTIRIVIGLSLLLLGPITEFITPDKLSDVLMGLAGSLALISAFLAYCILYDFAGFDTIKNSSSSDI